MSNKPAKKMKQPLVPKPTAKQPDAAFPVDGENPSAQPEGVKKAAGQGAATPGLPPVLSTAPTKPLTPMSAMWPSSIPPQGKPKVPQVPAPQVQKSSAPPSVPGALPSPTTPSPKPLSQLAPTKAAVTAPAAKPAAPRTVNIKFALLKPDAKRVSLCGEFNKWSPEATPMQRAEGGFWEKTVALAPGKYQYKFVVDGQWMHDPKAKENTPNQLGSLNSVVEVRL